MDIGLIEITEFSLLFAIPCALIMLIGWGAFVCVSKIRQNRIVIIFHWVDLLVPMIVTTIWFKCQFYALHTKSMGNLIEISILGIFWGIMFLIRGWLSRRRKESSIWLLFAVECAIAVLVALLAPTFPE
jgi:hypothetical protein